jgi:hypothetical protein
LLQDTRAARLILSILLGLVIFIVNLIVYKLNSMVHNIMDNNKTDNLTNGNGANHEEQEEGNNENDDVVQEIQSPIVSE